MYFLQEYLKKHNIDNQLPNDIVFATDSYLTVDTPIYRVCVYGWPDNRVTVANKITGINTIKRFGPNGHDKCECYLRSCLEYIGVNFPEEEK